MNFAEDAIDSPLFIRHYDSLNHLISSSLGAFAHPIVLFEGKVLAGILPAEAGALTVSHFQQLLALKPEVILLGTGEVHLFPEPALLAPLYPARIGLEVMTTDAACRTFNVLVSEGRSVLAALFV